MEFKSLWYKNLMIYTLWEEGVDLPPVGTPLTRLMFMPLTTKIFFGFLQYHP